MADSTTIQPGKILVAEDEPDIAQIVKFLLESKGHKVTVCPNGEEALKTIPDLMPDLLILDVMMPKMSGFALVKELKKNENFAGIPILMVSGISKGSDKSDEFWQNGMNVDDYVTKPFEPKDLVTRVENLLRKKREGWLDKQRDGTLNNTEVGTGSISVKSMTSAPIESSSVSVAEATPKTPEEVVKTFIESWNKQQFEQEYQCLSSRLAYTNLGEYVQRRRSYYAETNGRESHKQSVQKIVSSKISGNNAQVDIVRLDTEGNKSRISKESYILIQENDSWKINAVKTG
jgi:DNA-binding response OmpR family regulator